MYDEIDTTIHYEFYNPSPLKVNDQVLTSMHASTAKLSHAFFCLVFRKLHVQLHCSLKGYWPVESIDKVGCIQLTFGRLLWVPFWFINTIRFLLTKNQRCIKVICSTGIGILGYFQSYVKGCFKAYISLDFLQLIHKFHFLKL